MRRDTILTEGSVFDGRFEVLSELGSGSFGRVYRARQRSTGQLVAIKVMRILEDVPEAEIQAQVDRFLRETQLCAELAHPNLVALLDSGESDQGQLYAVFEHVPGVTLADLLAKEGAPAPREALRLMLQVLDALAALHRQGIVHRDVKPANVMVSGTGGLRNAKLLDLGLGGFAESRRHQMRRLTQSRELMGTPLYAAPEQLLGEAPSPRSDLYSWGLVFLECLTGEHVFERDFAGGMSLLERREVPLPPGLRRHTVGKMIARVTHPNPVQRDADASQLVRELERVDASELETLLGRDPAGPIATRRQLTIVSCRVAIESDELGDLEERDALIRHAHVVCTEVAARHGGNVDVKLGQRVVLHFGYPVAHESDARRAARAAMEIAQRITREGGRRGGAAVSAHLGLHTGPVITREVRGPEGLRVTEVVGATPEIATQLAELAGPGEVFLSDTSRRLVGPALPCAPAGQHALGGHSRPAPVYRVLPETPPGALGEHPETEFIGREDELSQLAEAWRRAGDGSARCLVLRGEAGIGKSRLVRELRARVQGGRWLESRCLEETSDTPLRPAIDLLRSTGQPIDALLERFGFDLPATVPLFRSLLAQPQDERFPKAQHSPERESSILLETMASLLLEMSLDEPTVLVCEDLHWADPTTRALIGLVLEKLRVPAAGRRPRLLLLLTTRGWAPEQASVLALPPLSADEVVRLVLAGLSEGEVPDAEVPDAEVLEQIVERSDGIPLFVEEVTRKLVELRRHGRASQIGATQPIPDSLEALLQARLDTLPERVRETTQVAAVIGREFDRDLLTAVADSRAPEDLAEDLAALARTGFVLARHSPQGESYVFRHALIREAAYKTMLRETRQACHARVAEVLEEDFPELSQREPQTLAWHLGEAGQHARAAPAWHTAGRLAMARAAYQEAISRFEKGLRALEALPVTTERRREEVALLESLGMAYYSTLGYAAPQVEDTFRRAEAICEEIGQDVPLQTLYGIWTVRFSCGQVEETAALVARMRERAERGDEPLAKLYAHGCYGLRSALLGDLAIADEQLRLSTRECEDPANLPHIRALPYGGPIHPPGWWSWVVCLRGHPDRARGINQRMRALAETLANAYGQAISGHFSSLLAQELGDVDAARELSQRQMAFSAEQKIVLWLLCSQCIHGWAIARQGEPEAGVAQFEQAFAMLRAVGVVSGMSPFLAMLAEAKLAAGDPDGALASVKQGMAMAETSLDHYYLSRLHRARAHVLRAGGDREGTEASLRQAIEIARAQGARWFELLAATDLAAQLGESGGRPEGHRLLAGVLDGFDEGSDLPPLREARALLTALA